MSGFDDAGWPAAAPKVRGPEPDDAGPPTEAMAAPARDEAHDGRDDGLVTPATPIVLRAVDPGAPAGWTGEWRSVQGERPLTPHLGLPAAATRRQPQERRRRPLTAVVASGAGVLLAVGLVAALVLRDGAQACDPPAALAAAPVAAVAAVGPVLAAAPPIDTSWSAGKVTFYGPASTGGACAASSVPANRYTVALGPEQYAAGAACGTYVDIEGERGTIRAKVTNLCPECERGHLDLSDEAFAALDDPGKGIAQVRYKAVRNPAVGPLTVQVKDGSNAYWLALRVDNHGNALDSVQVKGSGGSWQSMALAEWGFWVLASGAGDGPLSVRVTDVLGHRATVTGVRLVPGAVQRSDVRLYGAGSAAPSSRAPEPPATTTRTRTSTTRAGTPSATATPEPTDDASATPTATDEPTGSPTGATPSDPADDGVPLAGSAPTAAAPAGDGC